MEAKKVHIEYLLSEAGRKKSLLAGGDGKEIQVLEADITPEILELATVLSNGDTALGIGDRSAYSPRNLIGDVVKIENKVDGEPYFPNMANTIYFDAPQTAEALVRFEADRRAAVQARMSELQPEFDRLMTEYRARDAEKKAQRLKEETRRQEEARQREEALKVKRARREAEKSAWIASHGSDYLQRCTKLSYDCQRQYVTERAELELPGFAVDFDDRAGWKSRACPSEEALREVESLIASHGAEVVWLTSPVNPDDYEDECGEPGFDPCEAVVVSDYLGKYDLIKIV